MDRSILWMTVGLVWLSCALPKLATAQVPQRLSYQGVLTNADGTVVSDGIRQLRFRVYLTADGMGAFQFEQTLNVDVKDGIYNVILSDNGSYTLANAFSGQPRYMEIAVIQPPSTAVVMLPRQEIASVPYALTAARAAELTVPSDPMPIGAIILWKESASCPPGFEQLAQFNNLTIRGADLTGQRPEIPDQPGQVCDGGQPQGSGCGDAAARYNDVLEVAELAAHAHSLTDTEGGTGDGDYFDSAAGGGNGGGTVQTSNAGGGNAHYHPFATVLFCRYLGSSN